MRVMGSERKVCWRGFWAKPGQRCPPYRNHQSIPDLPSNVINSLHVRAAACLDLRSEVSGSFSLSRTKVHLRNSLHASDHAEGSRWAIVRRRIVVGSNFVVFCSKIKDGELGGEWARGESRGRQPEWRFREASEFRRAHPPYQMPLV